MVEAHRAGVEFGKKVYATPTPRNVDVLVANAYPIDTELIQAGKALWAAKEATRDGGKVVLVTASSEGLGYHLLQARQWREAPERGQQPAPEERDREMIVFSPNLGPSEVPKVFPQVTKVFNSWSRVVEDIRSALGDSLKVAVLPCASIQCPQG